MTGIFDPRPPYWPACLEISPHVEAVLARITCGPDNAAFFHDLIEYHLTSCGFRVKREVKCENPLRRTKTGRFDLVVEDVIAIEIDWKLPRWRSLAKLREFPGGRLIILRCARPANWVNPQGIDEVFFVPAVKPMDALLSPAVATQMLGWAPPAATVQDT